MLKNDGSELNYAHWVRKATHLDPESARPPDQKLGQVRIDAPVPIVIGAKRSAYGPFPYTSVPDMRQARSVCGRGKTRPQSSCAKVKPALRRRERFVGFRGNLGEIRGDVGIEVVDRPIKSAN